ncbi:MAG: hypothetical protein ACXW0G_01395 [Methylosarcina sp.]
MFACFLHCKGNLVSPGKIHGVITLDKAKVGGAFGIVFTKICRHSQEKIA